MLGMRYSTRFEFTVQPHNEENINQMGVEQVHEQLKTYLTEWRVLLHLKEAVSISSKVSKFLSKALHDPRRITNAPAVPDHWLKPQELPLKGLLPMPLLLENPTSTTLQASQSPHVMANTNLALTASAPGPVNEHVLAPPLPPHRRHPRPRVQPQTATRLIFLPGNAWLPTFRNQNRPKKIVSDELARNAPS